MNKRCFEIRLLVIACLVSISLSACGVYSFTGASISPDISTLTILLFTNQSPYGSTEVSQDLTDQLKDKFISETNLSLVDSRGDIEFKGTITGYEIRGQAPTANQTTAVNRLTITARVEYINRKNPKENWAQNFTRYTDYEGATSLESVESQLIRAVNTQLAEDIFNKAFVNW